MSQNPNYNLEEVIGKCEAKKEGFFSTVKSKVVALGAGAAVLATQAQAAIVAPIFDSGDAIAIGTAVIAGLALIWSIKKAIALAK